MFHNFLKIGWRNMLRHKLYSLINIIGLTLGLTSCMLILVYVNHELSFDRFHKKADRLYDLHVSLKMMDNLIQVPNISFATGAILKTATSSVQSFTRINKPTRDVLIEKDNGERMLEEGWYFADSNFLQLFSFSLEEGGKDETLSDPFSLVLSREAASQYFGGQDPIGKKLLVKTDSQYYSYVVRGVADNPPSNSTLQFRFLASMSSLTAMSEHRSALLQSQVLGPGDFKTYLLLKHPGDTGSVRRTIEQLLKADPNGSDMSFPMVNLKEVHLKNNLPNALANKYFSLFPFIALLILGFSLINFISLSTARASVRAKEIGVRKVSGAARWNVVWQFYVEAALYVLPAFLMAYGLCYASLSLFLEKLNIRVDAAFLYSPRELLSLVALLLFTIALGGSYPAYVLSGFQPILVLKGKWSKRRVGALVFKFFTVLQFTIAIAVIICGWIIHQQLQYMRSKDTGLDRSNVVMIPLSPQMGTHYESFKKEVLSLSGVAGVASSRYPLYKGYDMFISPGIHSKEPISLSVLPVDTGFIRLLGIHWKVPPLEGTNWGSSDHLVINEVAQTKLEMRPNPLGEVISDGSKQYEVSGVVHNFNFASMAYAIKPMCFVFYLDTAASLGARGGTLYIKLKPFTVLPQFLENLKNLYQQYRDERPFSYNFLDEAFDQQYKAEDRLSWLLHMSSLLTLFLSLIGLFGLSSFAIEQRTKEVGIRKVLGASIWNLNLLLARGFLILVVIAAVLASCLSWWTMKGWLENFSYRINLNLSLLLLADGGCY